MEVVFFFGSVCLTGLIGKMSLRGERPMPAFFSPRALSPWSEKEAPLVSWCLSSRRSVNGHEPHASEIIKVK